MAITASPYAQRRIDAETACFTKGHGLLAESIRGMSHLTDDERQEGERLISLPYGAEEFALRRFVGRHYRMVAA